MLMTPPLFSPVCLFTTGRSIWEVSNFPFIRKSALPSLMSFTPSAAADSGSSASTIWSSVTEKPIFSAVFLIAPGYLQDSIVSPFLTTSATASRVWSSSALTNATVFLSAFVSTRARVLQIFCTPLEYLLPDFVYFYYHNTKSRQCIEVFYKNLAICFILVTAQISFSGTISIQ